MKSEKTQKNIIHEWTLICQSSSVDANNNSLSLFNLIEDIHIEMNSNIGQKTPETVTIPLSYSLVTLWKRKINSTILSADIEVKLFDPNGKELQKAAYQLIVPPEKIRMRGIMNSQGFTATIDGEYLFKIFIKEKGEDEFTQVGETPVMVNIKKNILGLSK